MDGLRPPPATDNSTVEKPSRRAPRRILPSSSTGSTFRTRLILVLGFAIFVHLVTQGLVAMWSPSPPAWPIGLLGLLPSFLPFSSPSSSSSSQIPPVDLGWYPPKQWQVNDLSAVVNGTGTWGFVFNSSTDPPGTPYGTYNWCNMPHVRRDTYVRAPEGFDLVYVELIHRHHKRTPYAANGFPVEPYHWNCDDQGLFRYGQHFPSDPSPSSSSSFSGMGPYAAARTYWQGVISPVNPFVPSGWTGTCQFPQITAEGLDDAFQHGRDLYDVYHNLLGFLPSADEFLSSYSPSAASQVAYRVTTNEITSQTASNVIAGMWTPPPSSSSSSPAALLLPSIPLLVQAPTVDSLEPSYPCPAAASLFQAIQSPSDPSWAAHLAAAAPFFAALDAVSGVPPADPAFHTSFDHYYDNLSARQCHQKPLPCNGSGSSSSSSGSNPSFCVTQSMADAVYRQGNWEWSHAFRDAGPASLHAAAASLGVWIAELAAHLRAAAAAAAATATRPGNNNDNSNSSSDSSSDKTDNNNSREPQQQTKWFHNVAHDGSMGRLLAVLQADEMVWPGMGSEVVFELYRNATAAAGETGDRGDKWSSPSGHYVRVLWGGRVLRSSNPSLGAMDMVPVETVLAYFDGLVGANASLVVGLCREVGRGST